MNKIIIENQTDKPMIEVLGYVAGVISQGRISNGGKQYCYATRFRENIMVVTDLNKRSDRFVIYKEATHGKE